LEYVCELRGLHGRRGPGTLTALEILGLDRDPVARNAGVDGLGQCQPALGGVAAEQPRGMPCELPSLRPPVLDQGVEAFGIEVGKFGAKLAHVARCARLFLTFFLLRFYL
jgi:hypothetical protein